MDVFYDFNNCRESLKAFGGSDKKESIFFNGKRYMVKYNDDIPEEKRNAFTSSSRNNAFSEYVSCHIFEAVGIPVQHTLLGERKGHIVVACEDFCVNGYDINEFEKNSSRVGVNFKDVRYPEISDVLDFIRDDISIDAEVTETRFWDTFVMDALLGNFDRHTGNWGYLYNDDLHEKILAPVYDCGACLYPMLSDDGMKNVITSQEEINTRIFNYPKAAFSFAGEKISYFNFLTDQRILSQFPLLTTSIKNIGTAISRDVFNDVIDNTPRLSEIRGIFYKTMIRERFEKIILPAVLATKDIKSTDMRIKGNQVSKLKKGR